MEDTCDERSVVVDRGEECTASMLCGCVVCVWGMMWSGCMEREKTCNGEILWRERYGRESYLSAESEYGVEEAVWSVL
jgi:hypothetical protein